ncbi:mandelate racemase/muconate lactonizing enzyme family protein [Paraburkholderia silviterrae]|uniref:Mandelate racemase/muconate lactonizing enzyme family protein n=1 Tax=Paraburkholderia silviterrae TaxID=2528715 RepID=A0A4R5M524_9BURK|nr:mandelate racemase/muconate lactonizing enzyme family protein [Paraburkholderia silviterrae]TDG20336.1 mandelate racemase/muconate lactonizing enzyme family protein [Paraburkholderia silviterrae]
MTNRIARITVSQHRLPLDPPFPASWDSRPRRAFPATIVRVEDTEGRVGIGSGDAMYGFDDYRDLFIGADPLDLARHAAVLDNLSFHAGRLWPLDVALWDLAGKILGQPCWQMAGARTSRVRAYASSGVHRSFDGMARWAEHAVARGFPALKVRFGRASLADDLAALAAVREAAGEHIELMVDCNQGWRMPWDTQAPWRAEEALAVIRQIERHRVYWVEEPLHRGDYTGHAWLRKQTDVRIAGGEMTREAHEFATLLAHECLDVYQPDVVCTLGMEGARRLAAQIEAHGKVFTPHTWGNGIGLAANLHVVAGAAHAPFVEFPYDPPEWTPARRDFPLTRAIEPDAQGWIELGTAPGLGIELNEAVLAATRASDSRYD